jgi:hypothetical protein
MRREPRPKFRPCMNVLEIPGVFVFFTPAFTVTGSGSGSG